MSIEINCWNVIYLVCLLVLIFGKSKAKKAALWIAGIVFVIQIALNIIAWIYIKQQFGL